MICPRLTSEARLLPGRIVYAAREGPVPEPPEVGAGTQHEGQASIVDPRVITIVSELFRNAQRKATRFPSRSPAVEEQKLLT
jgi:hypothetical protein